MSRHPYADRIEKLTERVEDIRLERQKSAIAAGKQGAWLLLSDNTLMRMGPKGKIRWTYTPPWDDGEFIWYLMDLRELVDDVGRVPAEHDATIAANLNTHFFNLQTWARVERDSWERSRPEPSPHSSGNTRRASKRRSART